MTQEERLIQIKQLLKKSTNYQLDRLQLTSMYHLIRQDEM